MSVWQDVKIANRDLKQVEFELNRKLRQFFGNISPYQLNGGLPDLTGILPLDKGGTGQNLSNPTFNSLLFYNVSLSKVAWLLLGNSIVINAGILDTIQDIRTTASPTFKDIVLTDTIYGKSAQIGDVPAGNFIEINNGFRIYENNALPDRILFYDISLGSSDWLYVGDTLTITDNVLDTTQATDRCQLDITGVINTGVPFSTNASGTNFTKSGDSVSLGTDATAFNGNINLVILRDGVEQIKASDVVFITEYTFSFPSTTFDSGDIIVIKG